MKIDYESWVIEVEKTIVECLNEVDGIMEKGSNNNDSPFISLSDLLNYDVIGKTVSEKMRVIVSLSMILGFQLVETQEVSLRG